MHEELANQSNAAPMGYYVHSIKEEKNKVINHLIWTKCSHQTTSKLYSNESVSRTSHKNFASISSFSDICLFS